MDRLCEPELQPNGLLIGVLAIMLTPLFFWTLSPAIAETNLAPARRLPRLDITGFVDGNLEALGAYDAEWSQQTPAYTGDPGIDEVLQQRYDPTGRINLYWDTAGNVSLVRSNGNVELQLMEPATGDSSVSQTISIPPHATAVTFDLGVVASSSDSALNVLFNGTLLQSIPLSNEPSSSHVTVLLPASIASAGAFTFALTSPTQSAATITLGNFAIASIPNTAPTLVPTALTLPMIMPSVANNGILVSDLLGGISDPDPDARPGIAVVGADTLAGTLQYTLDDGTTWRSVGLVSNTNALLLAPDNATRLRFLPNPGFAGNIDSVLTFRAWDQTTGIAGLSGEYFDASNNGGTTAFSSATTNVSVRVVVPPTSSVSALPTFSPTTILLNWSGSDPS